MCIRYSHKAVELVGGDRLDVAGADVGQDPARVGVGRLDQLAQEHCLLLGDRLDRHASFTAVIVIRSRQA